MPQELKSSVLSIVAASPSKKERLPLDRPCSTCGVIKPLSDYHMTKVKYRFPQCKACVAITSRKWRDKNKERCLAYKEKRKPASKEYFLKKRYGITLNDYNEMFAKQCGRCICCEHHQSELKKILVVDHDHKTGIVRGLLCDPCNTSLGRINDDINTLHRMIRYLEGGLC